MDDVVSRQQVIDALDKRFDNIPIEQTTEILQLRRDLRQLPSAQPTFDAMDTQYNLPIGTDLISRQALLDKFEPWLKVKDYNDGELNMLKAILYEIRFMPSAQPEIIQCKDCKYWDTTWQNDYAPNYHYCPMIDGTRRNDFYCAYAERKEETT